MAKKSNQSYEEALAFLERVATPSQRFAKAIAHASGIDRRDDVRADVVNEQEDYRERMRRALVAVAERRMGSLNNSIEFIGEIEDGLRKAVLENKDDLTPAEQVRIMKALGKNVELQIELLKELAFKPEPGTNITIDARSVSVGGEALGSIPSAVRERMRLMFERMFSDSSGPSAGKESPDAYAEPITAIASDVGGEPSTDPETDN